MLMGIYFSKLKPEPVLIALAKREHLRGGYLPFTWYFC